MAEPLACEIEDTHDEGAAADMVERRDTPGPALFPADRVPARGEVIKRGSDIEVDVLDFEPRRIRRARVHALPALMTGI